MCVFVRQFLCWGLHKGSQRCPVVELSSGAWALSRLLYLVLCSWPSSNQFALVSCLPGSCFLKFMGTIDIVSQWLGQFVLYKIISTWL